MLLLYKIITYLSGPFLSLLLALRTRDGKEDATRLHERKGKASSPRPKGHLIWVHAASVGEAQSALILIERLSNDHAEINFLVTSGTRTSAELMAKRLPANAVHQYYPLDHPRWVTSFLNHWKPDHVLWMESELWPNMLTALKTRNIPAALINARLSDRSFKRWQIASGSVQKILSSFRVILAQTKLDQDRFNKLGAHHVVVTDNVKYSAAPLPFDDQDLQLLRTATEGRPLWLYASTHAGEEEIAADVHAHLKVTFPDLLTIIVPRHPERRDAIESTLKTKDVVYTLRGNNQNLPTAETDIYVADTLGELGLFYSLSSIAMIGRSMSHDGGGGHNPIEAAQLECAVMAGPNVQNQTQLFNEMVAADAVAQIQNQEELSKQIVQYLHEPDVLNTALMNAKNFAQSKAHIIDDVIKHITPFLDKKST